MSSVSSHIQRAIIQAINEQFLPQIQARLWSGQGQVPRKGLNVPAERPEYRSEETFIHKYRSSSRDEFFRNVIRDQYEEDTHYTVFVKKVFLGKKCWLSCLLSCCTLGQVSHVANIALKLRGCQLC